MSDNVGKVTVDLESCTKCGKCFKICPANAIELDGEGFPVLAHPDRCTECGICEDQCPKDAITVRKSALEIGGLEPPVGDPDLKKTSDALVDMLQLEKVPVGIHLMAGDENPPDGFRRISFPVRHCVSIHMASLGAALYVPGDQHACAAAKAALGIAELPEKVSSGKIPYMHGLASSEQAAARIMAEVPRIPLGRIVATLVAPLFSFQSAPEVVVLTANPKQAMWVANSLIFHTGGPRITANFAGMQASCADVTVMPIVRQEVNFSLGCYGCRSAGKLGDEEMYVGVPMKRLSQVTDGLRGLRRAMGKLEDVAHREVEGKKGLGA